MNCNYELKQQVWRAILQGQAVVTDTVTFTQVSVRKCPNIKIMYVTKEDITELTSHLQAQTRPLPGTHKCHFVKPVDSFTIAYCNNSIFTNPNSLMRTQKIYSPDPQPQDAPRLHPQLPVCPYPPQPAPQYIPGDFVHAAFNSGSTVQSYVGQVVTAKGNEYEVSFLRAANYSNIKFVFPVQEDKVWISPKQVIQKLDFPDYCRGHYKFRYAVTVT